MANNRKQTVDDEFVTSTFERVSTLKKLDQIKVSGGKEGKQELGKLPAASVALLIVLPVVWVILGAFYLKERLAEKKKQKEQNK